MEDEYGIHAPDGYACMEEAVDRVGLALFGNRWCGRAESDDSLIAQYEAAVVMVAEACAAGDLMAVRPGGSKLRGPGPLRDVPRDKWNVAGWKGSIEVAVGTAGLFIRRTSLELYLVALPPLPPPKSFLKIAQNPADHAEYMKARMAELDAMAGPPAGFIGKSPPFGSIEEQQNAKEIAFNEAIETLGDAAAAAAFAFHMQESRRLPRQDEPMAANGPLSGRGRPPESDWPDGIAFAEQELNQRGDPKKPENQVEGWRSDADVGRAVIAYLAKRNGGKEPDLKNAMKKIGPAIKEWRRKNA